MPRGKKQCPECQSIVGAAAKTCACGFSLSKANLKKVFGLQDKKPKYADYKRSFLKRMIGNQKPDSYPLEMSVVKKIFDFCLLTRLNLSINIV